ncbi:uncharacterized protein PAC_04665 [Phialocephala subalpina]|uniref:Uncharacterized protein n=1 Tax=Phialocephala subalpina TaxID=576137 RepID=A0A1L7WPW8_9HELO|nr:uncharacterized protein PAC_04665 [Phialocephala subalpina]
MSYSPTQEEHLPTTPVPKSPKSPKTPEQSSKTGVDDPDERFGWRYTNDGQKVFFSQALKRFPPDADRKGIRNPYWVVLHLEWTLQEKEKEELKRKVEENTEKKRLEQENLKLKEKIRLMEQQHLVKENKRLDAEASESKEKAAEFEKAKNAQIHENNVLKKRLQEQEKGQKTLTKTLTDLQAGYISLDEKLTATSNSRDSFKTLYDDKLRKNILLQGQTEEKDKLVADLRKQITELRADLQTKEPLVKTGIALRERFRVETKHAIKVKKESLSDTDRKHIRGGGIAGHRADGDADAALFDLVSKLEARNEKEYSDLYGVGVQEYRALSSRRKKLINMKATLKGSVAIKGSTASLRSDAAILASQLEAMGSEIDDSDEAEATLRELENLVDRICKVDHEAKRPWARAARDPLPHSSANGTLEDVEPTEDGANLDLMGW